MTRFFRYETMRIVWQNRRLFRELRIAATSFFHLLKSAAFVLVILISSNTVYADPLSRDAVQKQERVLAKILEARSDDARDAAVKEALREMRHGEDGLAIAQQPWHALRERYADILNAYALGEYKSEIMISEKPRDPKVVADTDLWNMLDAFAPPEHYEIDVEASKKVHETIKVMQGRPAAADEKLDSAVPSISDSSTSSQSSGLTSELPSMRETSEDKRHFYRHKTRSEAAARVRARMNLIFDEIGSLILALRPNGTAKVQKYNTDDLYRMMVDRLVEEKPRYPKPSMLYSSPNASALGAIHISQQRYSELRSAFLILQGLRSSPIVGQNVRDVAGQILGHHPKCAETFSGLSLLRRWGKGE